MLFTKKYKNRLADAEKEIGDLKESVKKLSEAVSKKYIHEQDKEEQYNVAQIVDEWLNGERSEGDD